jgi:hypothetical protein
MQAASTLRDLARLESNENCRSLAANLQIADFPSK